jgi:hypothetical protein
MNGRSRIITRDLFDVMTPNKKRFLIVGILMTAIALAIGSFVYHVYFHFQPWDLRDAYEKAVVDALVKPHALPGVDPQRWAQLKVGMTKEEVTKLLGDTSSQWKRAFSGQRAQPREELGQSEYWEWGFTYGFSQPGPHERAFVVYFDRDGKVSSFRAPQVAKKCSP